MIARKTWFFSASVAEERWAQVTARVNCQYFAVVLLLLLLLLHVLSVAALRFWWGHVPSGTMAAVPAPATFASVVFLGCSIMCDVWWCLYAMM